MTTVRLPCIFAWWPACRSDAYVAVRTDPPVTRPCAPVNAYVAVRTDPPVTRPCTPVFIQDAVTPFRGETLLLSRLPADLEARAD